MGQETVASTFVIYANKANARTVCRRLRDHGVPAGIRGGKGNWEVFGFPPDRLGVEGVRDLCIKVLHEVRT